MRLLWVIAAVLVAFAAAQNEPCSGSGDPHFRMFSSAAHDFQGKGLYEILNHSSLEVQGYFDACNSGGSVTCTRSITIKFKDGRGDNPIIVRFGWWSSTGYDPIYIDGTTYNPASQFTSTTLRNKYSVTFSGGRLNIVPPTINGKQRQGWSITLGPYSFVIAAPIKDPEFDKTGCGICGDLYGDPASSFTDASGSRVQSAKANQRVNGAITAKWGQSFNVSNDQWSKFKPILNTVPQWNHKLQRVEFTAVPLPSINLQEVDANQQVVFTDTDAMNEAKTFCERQSAGILDAGQKQIQYDNCLFDHARSADAVLAGANPNAALTAQSYNDYTESSSSGPSSGAVAAAVVCSIIAALAIAAAVFYFWRSRRLQEDLTKALVPINMPLNSQPIGARDTNINLSVANGI